ncbi:MAG: pseudouridine synthase [Sandarakinorhabdus sp.]|nr:pseudouridine synthase [Sandarakinorhabdus sp.]
MGAAMRPPRKPTGGKPTGSKRPPASRPFTERPARGAQRDAEGRPSTRGESRPPARGPQRDAAPARGEERRERPARSERPTRDERPRRSDRPARATGGPGQPARPQAGPSAPRGKRPPPPVRETEIAPQRIAKALARAGVGSRRDIERMIAEGRVAIDGEPLTSPALNIASLKGVTVDGQPVAGIAPAKLYRFHKPAGFLTTARDPAGRPTIMDILPADLPRVVPVGRLDMNTEGLLLLTTDGELKRALELPSSQVPRVYRVRAFGEVSQKALESLADGATIDGVHYGPVLADIERRMGHNLWLIVTIREGKNREVRRVLEHVGLQVNRLIRIAYGPVGLDDLPPRMADEVPDSDLQALKAMLKAGLKPAAREQR